MDIAPGEPENLAEGLAELAGALHDEPSVAETVELVLDYTLKALDCEYAGVVFVHGGGRLETAAATHPMIETLAALQAECGEGPDINVIADRSGVIVTDTLADERWPTWARQVASLGIRSVLSVRLSTSSTTVGCLDCYHSEPGRFDDSDQAVAHLLARHAAVALASARDIETIWKAVDSRKLIGQAQGILMERHRLTADQAFAVLVRYSQDRNIKLRDIAGHVVSTLNLPGPEAPTG